MHYHRGKLGRPLISAHKNDGVLFSLLLLCLSTKNAQTNCQCFSSQFIASKMLETHSRGNTAEIGRCLFPCNLPHLPLKQSKQKLPYAIVTKLRKFFLNNLDINYVAGRAGTINRNIG